jgi:DNA-binding MarR family transcriptional regulator
VTTSDRRSISDPVTKYLPKTDDVTGKPLEAWDIMRAIWRAPAPAWLSKSEKLLLGALNSHDGKEGIYPTYPTLRRETGIASDQTLKKVIDSLVSKGWLEYVPGTAARSNNYLITVPASVQRVVKVAKSGKPYVDFIFPERPPGAVARTSEAGAAARQARKVKESTTVSVVSTTATVVRGTTVTVDKEVNISTQESSHCSYELMNDSSSHVAATRLADGLEDKAPQLNDSVQAIEATPPQLNDKRPDISLPQLHDFDLFQDTIPRTTATVVPTDDEPEPIYFNGNLLTRIKPGTLPEIRHVNTDGWNLTRLASIDIEKLTSGAYANDKDEDY